MRPGKFLQHKACLTRCTDDMPAIILKLPVGKQQAAHPGCSVLQLSQNTHLLVVETQTSGLFMRAYVS